MKNEDRCAKCGACTVVCPIFQVTGRESLSPRGRVHLLKKLSVKDASPALVDILSQCLLCGACLDVCPRQVDIPAQIIKARQELPAMSGGHPFHKLLIQKLLARPILLAGTVKTKKFIDKNVLDRLPPESGLRLRLGIFGRPLTVPTEPPQLSQNTPPTTKPSATDKAATAYFAGCHALYLDPDIGQTVTRLSSHLADGLTRPKNQTCCGLAAFSAGNQEEARCLAQKNIQAFADNDLPILTSCGSCFDHLANYPRLFPANDPWHSKAQSFARRLGEFSSIFNKILAEKTARLSGTNLPPQRIFYHDPCHLRFGPGITAEPRDLLSRLPGVTLVELPGGPQCCGQGGLFNIAHPELSHKISRRLIEHFESLNADVVTTTCSGCLLQWQHLKSTFNLDLEVIHLALFLARFLA